MLPIKGIKSFIRQNVCKMWFIITKFYILYLCLVGNIEAASCSAIHPARNKHFCWSHYVPTNGHSIALLRMILNSKRDRILWLTSPSGVHIFESEQKERLHCSVSSFQLGAWMMAHNNLISEQKRGDGIRKKKTETCKTWIHTPQPPILSSLSSSHHLDKDLAWAVPPACLSTTLGQIYGISLPIVGS